MQVIIKKKPLLCGFCLQYAMRLIAHHESGNTGIAAFRCITIRGKNQMGTTKSVCSINWIYHSRVPSGRQWLIGGMRKFFCDRLPEGGVKNVVLCASSAGC